MMNAEATAKNTTRLPLKTNGLFAESDGWSLSIFTRHYWPHLITNMQKIAERYARDLKIGLKAAKRFDADRHTADLNFE